MRVVGVTADGREVPIEVIDGEVRLDTLPPGVTAIRFCGRRRHLINVIRRRSKAGGA